MDRDKWLDGVIESATAEKAGKPVEFRRWDTGVTWVVKEHKDFDPNYEYRPVREPKYRSYRDDELTSLLGKVVRHKTTGQTEIIIGIHNTNQIFGVYAIGSAGDLFANWTFLDGTPCGVLE